MKSNRLLQKDMAYILEGYGDVSVFENKNILITGCAGFLGFNFVQFFLHLMKKGVKIKSLILLDSFILGRPDWINEIEAAGDNKIKFLNFDISKDDLKEVESALEADFVIHMASIASPTFYRKFPIETIDANVLGLKKLLECYKDSSIDGFLFFSSSEIYGDPSPESIPPSEEYLGNVSCIGPRACYDEAKRFGETLCNIYSEVYGMPIGVVRPFNNYGPGMGLNDKRVPADFAKAILDGEDIIIHSDGSPTRTFCYVADAIVGYLKALTFGKYEYLNIGIDTPEISIKELADIYVEAGRELFDYKGKVIYEASTDSNYLTHNPSRRCPDITKAKKLLGFSPQIGVRDGVRRFLEFLKEELA